MYEQWEWIVQICWVLLNVHRNRRLIREGSPGQPPRLSCSSWALYKYAWVGIYCTTCPFSISFLKREKEQVPLPCPFSAFLQGTGGGSSGTSSSIFTTEISASVFTTDLFHASVESDILLVLVSLLELQPVWICLNPVNVTWNQGKDIIYNMHLLL